MKKLTLFFLALLAVSFAFQACDNTKTYAEMLDEEKSAIKAFIKDSNIVVISQSEFHAQDSMTYDNEYVQLASGVYMHIVDKGSTNLADTIKPNDLVLVRFKEYGLIEGVETLSNLNEPTVVDEFRYTVTSSSIAGLFTGGYMYMAYGSSVPAGWLVALTYVRDGAHVKLIVPSKMGHQNAQRQVYPYYYDIQKFQIWN
ncbi:DUF4827 domain-containing protein [uncultured Bacteroides sp.]|uniref:DUF4827 domain-containing protein n=1 Tax=uncultured Bacteroides sp. TaxID=162156 RepID=UPI0023CF7E68|nr:DUF4827 domain-containing protein [uncultured Bacteroides sp.]MDE5760433.1 DUF4827 domain-containing protein [Bacteroides sp.]